MKKVATVLSLVGMLALAPPVSSQAGDEGWAALGGFIGGTIFSGIAHGSHHASHTSHHTIVNHYETSRSGHYEFVDKKVWHPGYWDYGYDECGRKTKVWVKGYYSIETVKVWVSDRHRHPYRPRHRSGRSHYVCR